MGSKLTIRSIFVEITAALLVLLFLYTAIMKLKDHGVFIRSLQDNPALLSFAIILSWLVPIIEIIIAVFLFLPITRRFGLLTSSILLSFFTCYIGYMILTSPKLPCTCGGIIEKMNWQQHFWFNTFFIITSLISWFLYPKRFVAIKRRSRTPANHSRQQFSNY
ncbi:MAG: MauE/DoxX family redox-associated membrane protein [Chitinophagaceae bacterium]